MNRYLVVRGLYDNLPPQGEVSGWQVVDLAGPFVVADCGDNQGRANKVAQALNDFDGGPL